MAPDGTHDTSSTSPLLLIAGDAARECVHMLELRTAVRTLGVVSPRDAESALDVARLERCVLVVATTSDAERFLAAIMAARARCESMPIAFLTTPASEAIRHAVTSQAAAWIDVESAWAGMLAHFARLAATADAAPRVYERLRVDFRLSPREIEVLRLSLHRLDQPAISAALEISRHTIKTHEEHVREKLGLLRWEDVLLAVAFMFAEACRRPLPQA